MFDLDKEVDIWSREFAGNACGRSDRVEELKDHLFCEIEKNIEEGLNPESAFLASTRRFGISEDLKKAFRKGRSIGSLLCDAESGIYKEASTKTTAIVTGVYLVLFAVMTFGFVYLFRGQENPPYLAGVLYFLAFVPLMFTQAFRRKSKAECAYFVRMFKKVF